MSSGQVAQKQTGLKASVDDYSDAQTLVSRLRDTVSLKVRGGRLRRAQNDVGVRGSTHR